MQFDKYRFACIVARPCTCNAPIHQTGIDEHDKRVITDIYSVDDDLNTATIQHNDIDVDDLDLVCSKCGKSWIAFNPIFNN